MNKTFVKGFLPICILCLFAILSIQAWAQDQDPDLTYSVSFTDQELDDLLAPIALYPDPLLAQMLPASTYPAEIAEADAWLNSGGDRSNIDDQSWEESVKAIARYPDVLRMMAGSMDWTANLGDAFLNQPEDVANAIQRLRWQAKEMGNLTSNDKQEVIIAGDALAIIPAQPQYVYVPVYDPVVVYVQNPTYLSAPVIFFGPPLVLGGWLLMDFDWGHHHVIYHGWNRPGWVNHARPHVHITNVYINKSRPSIRQQWRHDTSRGGPARYLASHPSGPNANRYQRTGEIRGRTPVQPKPSGTMFGPKGDTRSFSNRGRESRGIVNQQPKPVAPTITRRPAIPTPRIGQRPTVSSPGSRERRTIPTPRVGQQPIGSSPGSSKQRAIPTPRVSQRPAGSSPSSIQRPARTPSVTFGGYRGAGETKTQSLRGQTSRQSSKQVLPSSPQRTRDSVPVKRGASGDRQRR